MMWNKKHYACQLNFYNLYYIYGENTALFNIFLFYLTLIYNLIIKKFCGKINVGCFEAFDWLIRAKEAKISLDQSKPSSLLTDLPLETTLQCFVLRLG